MSAARFSVGRRLLLAAVLLAVCALAVVAALALAGGDDTRQRGGSPLDARSGQRSGPGAIPPGAIAPPGLPADAGLASWSCDRDAYDADTLAAAFDDAAAGETICLASGEYGTFTAGEKDGVVTVRPRPGAEASLAIRFESAANVRVEGVTVTSAEIRGASHDITIARSRFTGQAVINADEMAEANVVLEANRHEDIDTCVSCFQGRVHVEGNSGEPSGVVVRNSLFSGGNSDGVRADANGLQIIANEFTKLQDEDPLHTDPIQIYGGTRILIRANFFHDNAVSAAIMMADGGAGNVVEDNVVTPGGHTWAVTWFSDDGSVIRHNTFADGECEFGQRCGFINLGAKSGTPVGRGTIIRDNVMGGISNGGGDMNSAFAADHNLTGAALPGDANLKALPDYVGPPSDYQGYRLAAGSPGTGDASDGTDRGIG